MKPSARRSFLTRRQTEVVRLKANGLTYRQIGRSLCLSEETVHGHMANAIRALGVRDSASAVLVALRLRIIDPDDIDIPRHMTKDNTT